MIGRFLLLLAVVISAVTAADASDAVFSETLRPFLAAHCLDCHAADDPAGGVALDELGPVAADNAETWKSVWEQVALGEMPPAEADDPIAPVDRHAIAALVTEGLRVALTPHGGFDADRLPEKGNHIPHELLFGELPDDLQPTATPARLVRLHPIEHLTRLSALINREPAFDPEHPGLRAYGDAIGPNEDGEIKVYYGLDRVIGWVGGTAAYAASITGFPPMLGQSERHGLRSYPHLMAVNGAEATQIARTGERVVRFMAFGPEGEPYQFAKRVADIDRKYKGGDRRGLAESLFYGLEPKRPLTPIVDLMDGPNLDEDRLREAVGFLFESLTGRPPQPNETEAYAAIVRDAVGELGKPDGVPVGMSAIFLDRDALFRPELAEAGEPDGHGRIMLAGWELGLAVNASLAYLGPDDELKAAIGEGRLASRDDVRREVRRLLDDPSFRKPRLLQFFREYFDYDRGGSLCKDNAALRQAGGTGQPTEHYRTLVEMTAATDRLIERVLAEDRDVLRELLTTDRVVFKPKQDEAYYGTFVSRRKPPKDSAQAKAEAKKKRGEQRAVTVDDYEPPDGEPISVRQARVIQRRTTDRVLTTLPRDQRRGILTHPAWLVSHSDAMDNHAILRGRWVRERLLGGAVPDVPITVDAMLPDEPRATLRHRMRVTREEACWRCHEKMDPLGLPFELYNHIGLYRASDQEKPVDASGAIVGSGDPTLDGPVGDALEMIDRLAASERVEQVFVRHAFRFWIGRNETVADAPALQAAHRAYRESGGSMRALLVELLASDAFLYRTR